VEQEIGLIYRFKLNIDDFSFEKLRFGVCEINTSHSESNFEMISTIKYNNIELKSRESNALVNRQYAIISSSD